MSEVGLALHPDKTRIVYCKDARRRGSHEHTSFTFLGYGFRARRVRTRSGRITTGFVPAISKDALNKISSEVRSWRLHPRTGLSEADLARWINPIVRGWMNYYGPSTRRRCIPSWRASTPTCCAGCARSTTAAGTTQGTRRVEQGGHGNGRASSPTGPGSPGSPPSGDQNDKSRVTGDCYARFRESRGVRCPRLLDNAVTAADLVYLVIELADLLRGRLSFGHCQYPCHYVSPT